MEFKVTPDELNSLLDPKSIDKLKEMGGVEGLAKALHTDLNAGLTTFPSGDALAVDLAEAAEKTETQKLSAKKVPKKTDHDVLQPRIQFYGANALPPPKEKPIWIFMWEALQDKTLLVLMAAAVTEIGVGIYKSVSKNDVFALIDGIAILVAVIIVVLVGSVNDFRKQRQFRALNSYSQSLAMSKAIRDGSQQQVQNAEIVVGDIVKIETGDVLPADGILISGFGLQTDESSLTGESHAIKKTPEEDPFLLSGTKVVDGMGTMLVIGVGVNSLNGRTLLTLQVEAEETPLQAKLSKLADTIAKYGIISALLMIVVLLIAYLTVIPVADRDRLDIADHIISIFISAVTLIVVAVPEGLPLAVTLALAYATIRMLKDNNLVRHLAACETMGNATTICSDKTGTLTMNKMTVVKGLVLDTSFDIKDISDQNSEFIQKLKRDNSEAITTTTQGMNINSTATETVNADGKKEFIGSKTEVALVEFTAKLGFPYSVDRKEAKVVHVIPFNSSRKRMTTVIERNGQRYLHAKGASEIILGICSSYVNGSGQIVPIDEDKRKFFETTISTFASDALRTIGVAYKIVKEDEEPADVVDLVLLGIFGIQDPVRPEVPNAVLSCMKAGVVVRMVTGDNQETARSIAKQCSILTENGVVMEGPEFRKLSDAERRELVPKLQVLARSSPQDKQTLVNTLKSLGETVAVTGDGTNDAPALKAADVGFSMGIAGTEVAKEASDIVLMDDNFASLVKAVVWGRSVYDSVRKFLQFQLTVNVTAVVITVLSSFISVFRTSKKIPYSVLSAVQLLWVNLIMDTFAALALATDPPTPELLNRRPDKKSDPLISPYMFRQIIGQAIYQVIICLTIYLVGADKFGAGSSSATSDETGIDYYTGTMVFNVFVFCQIFNEINARSISRDINIFKGILNNHIFIGIFFATVVAQALIVEFGHVVFHTVKGGLNFKAWFICIAFGFGSIIVGFLIRLLPPIPERTKEEDMEADLITELVLNAVDPDHEKNRALWDNAIRKVRTQIRVANAFRDATAEAAFEEGVRVGAEAVIKSLSIEPMTGAITVDRERVAELWRRAKQIQQQVSIVRALRGGRRESLLLPGDLGRARSVKSRSSALSL